MDFVGLACPTSFLLVGLQLRFACCAIDTLVHDALTAAYHAIDPGSLVAQRPVACSSTKAPPETERLVAVVNVPVASSCLWAVAVANVPANDCAVRAVLMCTAAAHSLPVAHSAIDSTDPPDRTHILTGISAIAGPPEVAVQVNKTHVVSAIADLLDLHFRRHSADA